MAEMVVVVLQVPWQARICGVASREAAFTVPWLIVSVSAGSFLTVVVSVYAAGASQPTSAHSHAGVDTTTLKLISRAAVVAV